MGYEWILYILFGSMAVLLIFIFTKMLPEAYKADKKREQEAQLRKLNEEQEKKRQEALRKQQEVAPYRELFEMGALTREEFEAKKKQILG
ncbi:MAG: SHOCT domain-containing protein [Christensenellaceae bacterium]|nr:SHOCT domain-containing protein [Christensenellaceae bacterium]